MISIVKSKNFEIFQIENHTELAKTSKGTIWCTQEVSTAKEYLKKDGPIFLIMKNGKKAMLMSKRELSFPQKNNQQNINKSEELHLINNLLNECKIDDLPNVDIIIDVDSTDQLDKIIYPMIIKCQFPKRMENVSDAKTKLIIAKSRIFKSDWKRHPHIYNLFNCLFNGEKIDKASLKEIGKDALLSLWYARMISKGRFPDGEKSIMNNTRKKIPFLSIYRGESNYSEIYSQYLNSRGLMKPAVKEYLHSLIIEKQPKKKTIVKKTIAKKSAIKKMTKKKGTTK